ncbi:MAG: hypothetical protein J0G30_13205 [Actinomycetales bacterium]|nr:hypothetical protein [Actinomycetales bacterium]
MTAILVARESSARGSRPMPRRPARPPLARGASTPRRRAVGIELLLPIAAFALLAFALPAMRAADPAEGLDVLRGAGLPLVPALVLAVLGVLLAVRLRRRASAVVALLAVVLVLRLPLSAGSDVPIYSWTYKHLGVVDYIAVNGSVTHGVDVYSGWPAFFAAMAGLSQVTGVPALVIAQWFPVAIGLLLPVAYAGLARAFGHSWESTFLGALVLTIANWVGQDYFSPQAVAFLLGIAVLAALVGARRRPLLGVVAAILFLAVVMAHQLTPYWIIGVSVALGVFRWTRPRGIGIVLLIIAGSWVLLNLDALTGHDLVSSPDVVANAQSIVPGVGSDSQRLTQWAARLVALALIGSAGLAAVAGLRDRWIRRRTIVAGVIAFSSFVLLLGQSYGGEAIYRVYLYAIPGCALLVAPVLARWFARPPAWAGVGERIARGLAVVATCAVAIASLQAVDGAWFPNRVDPGAVTISETALAQLPDDARLVSPVSAGPGRMTGDYARMAAHDPIFDIGLDSWPGWIGSDFAGETWLGELNGALWWQNRPTYLLITDQMRVTAQYNGLFPPGGYDRFVAAIASSPDWEVVVDEGDAILYRLIPVEESS